MIIHGRAFVLGVPIALKPLTGFLPAGKMRYKFRNKSVGLVFFKTANSIRQFTINDDGETWSLGYEQGMNCRQ